MHILIKREALIAIQKELPSGPLIRLPTTASGWAAVGLLALASAGFGLLLMMAASGQNGSEAFSDSWWLAILGFAAIVAGFASGVASLYAVIRRGERSLLYFGAIFLTLMIANFIGGEILLPH